MPRGRSVRRSRDPLYPWLSAPDPSVCLVSATNWRPGTIPEPTENNMYLFRRDLRPGFVLRLPSSPDGFAVTSRRDKLSDDLATSCLYVLPAAHFRQTDSDHTVQHSAGSVKRKTPTAPAFRTVFRGGGGTEAQRTRGGWRTRLRAHARMHRK